MRIKEATQRKYKKKERKKRAVAPTKWMENENILKKNTHREYSLMELIIQ